MRPTALGSSLSASIFSMSSRGLELKDEKVKDRLKQARGDATTHFAHYRCPKKEDGAAEPKPPGGEAAGGEEAKPQTPEEVLGQPTDKCWKWRFTSTGVSGMIAEWEYFRAKVKVAGRYDALGQSKFLKAGAKVQVALLYTVQAFLGDADVRWDSARGMWTVRRRENNEDEVAVSPRCALPPVEEGKNPTSAESCGYDSVSGVMTVVASFKRIVDVDLGITFSSDGVVTDVAGSLDAAVQSVTARAYGQRVNFLHTPFLSFPLATTRA